MQSSGNNVGKQKSEREKRETGQKNKRKREIDRQRDHNWKQEPKLRTVNASQGVAKMLKRTVTRTVTPPTFKGRDRPQ